MLYVYIGARANLGNILAHIKFCEEFSTPFMRTTRMGYCLTTLEVAMTLLLEENELIQPAATEKVMINESINADEDNHFDAMVREHRKSLN